MMIVTGQMSLIQQDLTCTSMATKKEKEAILKLIRAAEEMDDEGNFLDARQEDGTWRTGLVDAYNLLDQYDTRHNHGDGTRGGSLPGVGERREEPHPTNE